MIIITKDINILNNEQGCPFFGLAIALVPKMGIRLLRVLFCVHTFPPNRNFKNHEKTPNNISQFDLYINMDFFLSNEIPISLLLKLQAHSNQ